MLHLQQSLRVRPQRFLDEKGEFIVDAALPVQNLIDLRTGKADLLRQLLLGDAQIGKVLPDHITRVNQIGRFHVIGTPFQIVFFHH